MSDDRASERCPILNGRVWALGLELPAECIAPPGAVDAPAPGALLLTPIDPGFPTRVEKGDILVAGRFAFGTTDVGPVRAIAAAGIAAVVASTLDPTFARLAREAGLPVVEVYEALAIHTGEILRVDLEGVRVVNMSSGDRYPIRNMDDETLDGYRSRLADPESAGG